MNLLLLCKPFLRVFVVTIVLSSSGLLLVIRNVNGQLPVSHDEIVELSCGDDIPVTKTDIENVRRIQGIEYRERDNLANAFEAFALESAGAPKYRGPSFFSDRAGKGVIPDAVLSLAYFRPRTLLKPRIVRNYNPGVFVDAKSGRSRIELSSGQNQTLGYIDYLANKTLIGGEGYVEPQLRYLTVEETVIDSDVRAEANRQGVLLMQRIACLNPGGTIGVDDMYMGAVVALRTGQSFLLEKGKPGSMFIDTEPPSSSGGDGSGGDGSGGDGSGGDGSGGDGSGGDGSGGDGSGGDGSGGDGSGFVRVGELPFTGGQCSGVNYDITVQTFTNGEPNRRNNGVRTYTSIPGPIGLIYGLSTSGTGQSPEDPGEYYKLTHDYRNVPGGLTVTYTTETVINASGRISVFDIELAILDVSRSDGQPDNCGDPPILTITTD